MYINIDLYNVIIFVNYCLNLFVFVEICGCCRSCPDVIMYESLHCFVFFKRLLCLTRFIVSIYIFTYMFVYVYLIYIYEYLFICVGIKICVSVYSCNIAYLFPAFVIVLLSAQSTPLKTIETETRFLLLIHYFYPETGLLPLNGVGGRWRFVGGPYITCSSFVSFYRRFFCLSNMFSLSFLVFLCL